MQVGQQRDRELHRGSVGDARKVDKKKWRGKGEVTSIAAVRWSEREIEEWIDRVKGRADPTR